MARKMKPFSGRIKRRAEGGEVREGPHSRISEETRQKARDYVEKMTTLKALSDEGPPSPMPRRAAAPKPAARPAPVATDTGASGESIRASRAPAPAPAKPATPQERMAEKAESYVAKRKAQIAADKAAVESSVKKAAATDRDDKSMGRRIKDILLPAGTQWPGRGPLDSLSALSPMVGGAQRTASKILAKGPDVAAERAMQQAGARATLERAENVARRSKLRDMREQAQDAAAGQAKARSEAAARQERLREMRERAQDTVKQREAVREKAREAQRAPRDADEARFADEGNPNYRRGGAVKARTVRGGGIARKGVGKGTMR